jgi:hypothetical protein
MSGRERVELGLAGLALAVVALLVSTYAGPMLAWAAGVVDWIASIF